jgi:hypothetical protein
MVPTSMRDACLNHQISFDFLMHVTKRPMSVQGVSVPATDGRKREG